MKTHWLQHRGTRYPISTRPALLGRSPKCLIVLGARRVSREHAQIRLNKGKLEIKDLESRNGTRVNGRLVMGSFPLQDGDVIELGEERLQVLVDPDQDLPETLEVGEMDNEPTALAQRNVVELAEELLLRGATTGERQAIAKTIYSMVDALVESMQGIGQCLSPGECVRLVAVCNVVARWADDESLEEWANEVRQVLVH